MNKRKLIYKLVEVPKKADKAFWGKEFKLLNSLLLKFPDINFWEKATILKVPSLAIYLSTELTELDRKYKMFNFQPELKNVEIELGNKAGEDYYIANKPKTIKGFLK